MAAALAADFFMDCNVRVLDDLLKRDNDGGIVGVHEVSAAALVFTSVEDGVVEGKVCLRGQVLDLSDKLWHFPVTLDPQRNFLCEHVNILDLAVLFGHTDLAVLLAMHGVQLCMMIADFVPDVYLESKIRHCILHKQKLSLSALQEEVLAAVIVAGGFVQEAQIADEWLGEQLIYRAILSGRADMATYFKQQGVGWQLESGWRVMMNPEKLFRKMVESGLDPLFDHWIWHAAARAGVDLRCSFLQVHLDQRCYYMNLLDVALLAGSLEMVLELFKAEVCISLCVEEIIGFLQAGSQRRMLVVLEVLRTSVEVPISFCAETVSQLLQLATARSVGQQYGVLLLQWLKNIPVIKCVLAYLVSFPSELQSLASIVHTPQADLAVTSSTRPAEVVKVSAAHFDREAEGGTGLPETSSMPAPQPSHTSADEEQKIPDAEEKEKLDAVIKRSRQDIFKLSGDNVVLLRLTRCSQTPETIKVLQTSPKLAHCHRRVQEAGCEFAPNWAEGAKFFVPITREQLDELAETGFQIEKNHVLALREDKAIIEEALDVELRGKKRVKVRPEHGWREEGEEEQPLLVEEINYSTDSEMGFPIWPGTGSSGSANVHSDI